MNPLKKLAGQTAIYGLSSIVGRLLNYFLVPLYTYRFATGQYGVVSEMYAYVGFFLIFLTYGMETTFFRFCKKREEEDVFGTAITSLLITSISFLIIIFFVKPVLANWLSVRKQVQIPYETYIWWLAIIVATDAFTAIPFARLRQQNKAFKFAFIKLGSIFINIGLNLFFILFCADVYKTGAHSYFYNFVSKVYNPHIGIGYIFIANLCASLFTLVLLFPDIIKSHFALDKKLWRQMLAYSLPLLILGLAGNINEMADRILLKYLLPFGIKINLSYVGIYSACYKISILMTIFIQAFRYAADPFFFSHHEEQDDRKIFAQVMKYFIIICMLIFVGVMMNINIIKFYIGKDYRVGLSIVPILLIANLFLGVVYNLSIWYKLTDKTRLGAYIAIIGAVITILLNAFLIPVYGYKVSAWATLICYFSMAAISYFWGQRYFPIPYNLKRIFIYMGLGLLFYVIKTNLHFSSTLIDLSVGNAFLLIFLAIIWFSEKPKKLKIEN